MMNWKSQEFIWLDWTIMAVGILAIVWAVWRSIQKHNRLQKGADSEDYLFGKGEPWYHYWCGYLCCKYRLRTSCGACRYRCKVRCCHGALGNARLDDPYFGMALCAVLSTYE